MSELNCGPSRAAEAVNTFMGYYPTIQASDPQIYVAGMITLFQEYPEYLISEAIDPHGLPSLYDFPPTLKQAKDFLVQQADEQAAQEGVPLYNIEKMYLT